MSSLHKHKRSPYWYCAFRDAKGKRVYRSTKTRDKDKAGDICAEWARLAKKIIDASDKKAARRIRSQSAKVIKAISKMSSSR